MKRIIEDECLHIKGFERLPDAIISLFAGENTGKMHVEME